MAAAVRALQEACPSRPAFDYAKRN